MVNHNDNNNLFQQYTPKENKHFQSELQSNGKAKAKLDTPDYMGKGANDYKKVPKHHISRKLSAILISIGVIIIALVVVGATASYHRDAPSTTSPNSVQQQPKHKETKPKKKIIRKPKPKTHKIKHTKPKDNVIQVTNNHAKVAPKKDVSTSKKSTKSSKSNSVLKPIKPTNIKKSIKDNTSQTSNNSSKAQKSVSQKNTQSSNNNSNQKTSTKSQQ